MAKKSEYKDIKGSVVVTGNVDGSITNQVSNSFNQGQGELENIDLLQLAQEFSILRQAMKQEATEVEHDEAIGEIAKAEKSAKNKDISGVMAHLKSVGKWTLDVATKIGVSIAVEVIKQSTGFK